MGWRRAVVEHVAKVAATSGAVDFGSDHAEASIDGRLDRARDRFVEARPSGPALEFEFRLEQGLAAADTRKLAGALLLQQGAASRRLGPMLSHHAILLGREQAAPFSVAVRDGIGSFHDSGSLR